MMEVGGWSCSQCLTPNQEQELKCAACGTNKPGYKPQMPTMPKITFGGTAAVTTSEWKPPVGPVRFGFASALASSTSAASTKENDKPSPVFGIQQQPLLTMPVSQAMTTSANVPASRLTFGRSDGGLLSIGDNATGLSTPTKGYRSPQSFCQTMETPAPKVGSPMLIGVGPEVETREVPESVNRMTCGCVWTWGSGECDQLAVRTENMSEDNQRATPIIIKALNTPICDSIAAGSMHSLAIVNNGRGLLSWGCNDEGTLGRPIRHQGTDHIWCEAAPPQSEEQTMTSAKAPGLVWNLPHDTPLRQVSAGGSHSAAITQSGDCYCWGCYRDQTGNIGFANFKTGKGSVSWYLIDPSESRPGQPIPTLVPGLEGVCIELVSGENHTGVLTALKGGTRKIYLWGAAEFGQLGIQPPDLFEQDRTASLFPISWTVSQFAFKWPEGQQDGSYQLRPHPNEIDLKDSTLLHLYGGKYATFFSVDMKGSIETFGFGKNACGELGAGFQQDIVVDPVPLKSVKGLAWLDIKGGEFFTIGLTCDGSVFTWGHKEYVGLGSTVAKGSKHVLEPRLVPGLKQRVVAIEASHRTAFALTQDGQLFAWGESSNYQIGDGVYYEDPVTKPLRVHPKFFDFGFVSSMAGGAQHTLALVKPCPEEMKTLETGRLVTAPIAAPAAPIAPPSAVAAASGESTVEQRGRKRARGDLDEGVPLTDRKRARITDHQVNTDQLPSLTNPLANTGPPSTTLTVPPPTPTESNDLKKHCALPDIELPPITEAHSNSLLQCESDIEGSDTPIRKPKEGESPELAEAGGITHLQEVGDEMDDGDPEDHQVEGSEAEGGEQEETASSVSDGEDDQEEQSEEEGESSIDGTQLEPEAIEDEVVETEPEPITIRHSQEKPTRGRGRAKAKAGGGVTSTETKEEVASNELRRTRAAGSRASAKKAPVGRASRTASTTRTKSGKGEVKEKAEKKDRTSDRHTKSERAKEKPAAAGNSRERAEKDKGKPPHVEAADKKKEVAGRRAKGEKHDEAAASHKEESTKNDRKRALSKAPQEETAAPLPKRSRPRRGEERPEPSSKAEGPGPAAASKRVTRGKKMESEPPPSKEEAKGAATTKAGVTRSRRGSKSKAVEEEEEKASQRSLEPPPLEPDIVESRVTRRKAAAAAEPKKGAEPKKSAGTVADGKAKAKAKAAPGGSGRRKGSTTAVTTRNR